MSGVKEETLQIQIRMHAGTLSLICIFYTNKEAGSVHLKNTGDLSTH